ncbi:hypothetical protein E0Z10_g6318 [Xylaria hypoxylon]|uniref:Rhodopsin domain-containing protein n=1 Tax=Xylaria hypoxylon TaxID=37992 RepID=A0A4Z0YTI3_9PEZI|nr:hypothetical protein E0Z10_g6318 [Xylaria hypoxylon]
MLGAAVDGDADRSGGLQSFIIAVIVFTVTSISLRFWSRSLAWHDPAMRDNRLFWWDDWFALGAALLLLAQVTTGLVAIHIAGFGKHLSTLSPEQFKLFFKLLYAGTFFFFTAVSFTKFSVLFFLSRVFPPHVNTRWYNYSIWACYALNTAWIVGITFAAVFLCDPVQKNWDPTLKGSCGTDYNLYLGNAIPDAIIDLAILLLPLPKLWVLHISMKKKLALAVIFILGYGVVAVSIGRFIQIAQIGDGINDDITWAAIPVFFWISAEPGISILCACLPALLPLCRKLAQRYPFTHRSRSDISKQGDSFYASRQDKYSSKDSEEIPFSSRNGISASLKPESFAV